MARAPALRAPVERVPRLAVDTGLAVAVTAFVLLTEVGERRHHEFVPTSGLLVLAGLAPALAVRRVLPGTSFALVAAVQVGLIVTGIAPGANVPAQAIAPYSTAAYGNRRVRIAAAVAAGLTLIALPLPGWSTSARDDVLGFAVASAGGWLLGTVMRVRRDRIGRLAERAERLERDRDLVARQAVADERLRIARELHDVVAHHLSVVVVQAQALQPMAARDASQARALAESIEETGREALEEMRRLLGVLRGGDTILVEPVGEGPPGPQPGLDRLDALIEQVRHAGLPITLAVTGDPGGVPHAVQVSAYRIVQEALTNVLKHAGPATAAVTVGYADAELRLTVSDDGRGAAAALAAPGLPGPGHGLLGMRERVALFGGEFAAGPRPGGGYEVRARLPVAAP